MPNYSCKKEISLPPNINKLQFSQSDSKPKNFVVDQ